MIGWKAATPDERIAGFRFRVRKPVDALRDRGHGVEIFSAEHADAYGAVVFSKSYSPDDLAIAAAVKARGGSVIFDLYDNHFYNPNRLKKFEVSKKNILNMIGLSDRVVCSTRTLAEIVKSESGVDPIVVGDIAERFIPRTPPLAAQQGKLRLLWFGSHGSPNAPGGMENLRLIREPLHELASSRAVSLTVLSNSREKFEALRADLPVETNYVEWSKAAYDACLAGADAVVLPVEVNPFTACKTHNRLTSALYAGKPTIATGLASYVEFADFCVLDDWGRGFRALAEGLDSQRERALAARPYIDEHWSEDALMPRWEEALALSRPSITARRKGSSSVTNPQKVYQGRLDAVAAGAITGWVRNLRDPETPLEVALEADGEVVMAALADLPRDDLKFPKGAQCRCGFALSLCDVSVADPALLKVKVANTEWVVGENPILLGPDRGAAPAAAANIVFVEESRATYPDTADPMAIEEQERLLAEVAAMEALLVTFKSNLTRALVAFENAPAAARAMRLILDIQKPAKANADIARAGASED